MTNQTGLIHIYCGDGKGKTTAAVGLCVRAAGSGMRVLFTQFFKDGSSGEVRVLREIPGVSTLHAQENYGRAAGMNEADRAAAARTYTALLHTALDRAGGVDLLVLDEAISTYNHAMLDRGELLDFLRHKPESLEVVLTGRNPPGELVELGDYVAQVTKIKHPFDEGVLAREGIEY